MKKSDPSTQFYYQNDKLVSVKSGALHRTIFRTPTLPLAEQSTKTSEQSRLLGADLKNSIFNYYASTSSTQIVYSPYGHSINFHVLPPILAFNGEHFERTAQCYLLGVGYRGYSPVIMRFHSPDNLSPFGQGGINSYAYCQGDPVNYTDETGHWPASVLAAKFRISKNLSPFANSAKFLHTKKSGLQVKPTPSHLIEPKSALPAQTTRSSSSAARALPAYSQNPAAGEKTVQSGSFYKLNRRDAPPPYAANKARLEAAERVLIESLTDQLVISSEFGNNRTELNAQLNRNIKMRDRLMRREMDVPNSIHDTIFNLRVALRNTRHS